jgi:lysophospholipase L1-like esterase
VPADRSRLAWERSHVIVRKSTTVDPLSEKHGAPMHRRRLTALAAATLLLTTTALAAATRADAAAGCQVRYAVSSSWPGGFGASVDITNLGDPLPGWSLTFTFTGGQTITQLWNGSVTQTGAAVTVRDAGWNGSLATNGTASFGFNGSWTGSNPVPAAFALNGTTCTGTIQPPTTPPPGAPVKIMALGDSITGSPGCWRALLWQKLPATRVDFVGTLPGQGCGFPYDGENEGHGGALVTTVADQDQLVGWLAAADPDIVLMHFGTNDVWSNLAPSTILAAYTRLVSQMRAVDPAMTILVAQIIPMNASNCPDCARRVADLNAAIPAWAAGLSTAASPITVVDQWTGFTPATDTYDGVHPNDAGNTKIADRWYPALSAAVS